MISPKDTNSIAYDSYTAGVLITSASLVLGRLLGSGLFVVLVMLLGTGSVSLMIRWRLGRCLKQ